MILSYNKKNIKNGPYFTGFVCLIILFCSILSMRPAGLYRDFNAFYCAGQATIQHKNPYLAEPLNTCEHVKHNGILSDGILFKNSVLPAPLPPYDFLFFGFLALFPYTIASAIFGFFLLCALAVCVYTIHKITQLPNIIIFTAIAPVIGYGTIRLGEFSSIAIALICLSAMFLSQNKNRYASTCAVLSMIEPHLAFSLICSIFLCYPKERIFIILSGIIFTLISITLVGYESTLLYFSTILPAHAHAEITSLRQFSLTSILYLLGFSDSVSQSFGSTSYLLMVVLGITLSRKLFLKNNNDPLVVLAPVAITLVGGVFMHITQIGAAIPCALVLYSRFDHTKRNLISFAILLLCIPWIQYEGLGIILLPMAFFTVGYLSRGLLKITHIRSTLFGGCAVAFLFLADYLTVIGQPSPSTIFLPDINPLDIAQVNWEFTVQSLAHIQVSKFILVRIPTWIGITLVAVLAFCNPDKATTIP